MDSINKVQVFNHEQFSNIRTVTIDGEPWLVGKDVAVILGYTNPRDALAKHVDDEDKNTVAIHDAIRGNPNMTVINESGFYSLVFASKLPTARAFKHWVTSKVLPSLRKHGGYFIGQREMSTTELLARALKITDGIIKEQEQQIAELTHQAKLDKPKVAFADAVAGSDDCILVGDLAKILKQNGTDIGPNRLFEWLRECGYLIRRKGSSWNMPTQRAMELGLFKIKERQLSTPTVAPSLPERRT